MPTLSHKIGTLVIFKGRGLGIGKIIYQRRNLYGIELIGKDEWVLSDPEHFSPIKEDDARLVTALDGVGLF
jgi:hypothetical protein